jgi:hypothetical protein
MATIADIIAGAAQQYGVDPNTMLAIGQIESGLDPNAQNKHSSAGGLFQFIDSTAQQYGLGNKFDAKAASDAAARLLRDNRELLRRRLGRDVSGADLYLAHQQGAGGASRLLAEPSARAADIVGEKAVRLNGGDPSWTAAQFADLWRNKFNKAAGMPMTGGELPEAAPAVPAVPAAPAFGGMDMAALAPTQPLQPPAGPVDPFSFVQPLGLRQKRKEAEERAAQEQARRQALFGDEGLASLYG